MPPRRRSTPITESLTPEQLGTLAVSLSEGRRTTVYLREGVPSLNLAPGSSAQVLTIEGTTVTVKPRGVADELPFEANELRITKTPPPPPEKPARKKSERAARATPKPAGRATPSAVPGSLAATPPATAEPGGADGSTAAAATAVARPRSSPRTASQKEAPQKRTSQQGSSRKPQASVTVTLHGTPDNEWSVAITRGTRKPTRTRPIGSESAEAAAHALGDDAALGAVTELIHAARDQARRRVEELARELEAAQQELAALERSDSPAVKHGMIATRPNRSRS